MIVILCVVAYLIIGCIIGRVAYNLTGSDDAAFGCGIVWFIAIPVWCCMKIGDFISKKLSD